MKNAEVKLWAYFPEGRKNITSVNVTQSQPIVVHLPQSIVIAQFDTPVYATNYTLRMSKNTAYRFEGKCNIRTMSAQKKTRPTPTSRVRDIDNLR